MADSFQQPDRDRVKFIIAPDLIVKVDKLLMKLALENLIGKIWKYAENNSEAIVEFGVNRSYFQTMY